MATDLRKRRGSIRGSITRLSGKLKDLEGKTDPISRELAHGMALKLESLDTDFHKYHFELLDTIPEANADALSKEQKTLDLHEEDIALLSARIRQVMNSCASPSSYSPAIDNRKVVTRKLSRLEKAVSLIREAINASPAPTDACLLAQFEEQLRDLKSELSGVSDSILNMDLDETDAITKSHDAMEKEMFNCGLKIKQLLSLTHTPSVASTPVSTDKGVKLPKLDVPTFDGQVINWRSFWEQFEVAIHSKSALSDSEKLAYLKHALKSGTAKNVIEGLSRSGEQYKEAIESLKSRYDRPRLLHQTHVRMILEAAGLKEGSGKELRRLHDTVQQHLRALTSMGYEPSGPFITSTLELKLDPNTMFEWQRASQSSPDVPHYKELLEFINLRAQASETSLDDRKKNPLTDHRPRPPLHGKTFTSYTSSTLPENENCSLCKNEKHQLYACPQFKGLTHDKKVATLKSQNRCLNCLRTGHFVNHCKSLHHCRKCQKPHHTLLHVEQAVSPSPPVKSSLTLTNHAASTMSSGTPTQSLLMTCRVRVRGPCGSSLECRALLDSASSASFVSECLAQSLQLPRSRHCARVMGIAGISRESSSQALTKIAVSPINELTREIHLTAVIMPRITCNLPQRSIPFKHEWNHLSDLTLADPDFGHPDRIDLLLGIDVFVQVMRQGRRHGPPGAPVALETDFGWVIAGEVTPYVSHASLFSIVSHHTTIDTGDKILQRFWEIEERSNQNATLSAEECAVVKHFQQCHTRTDDGRFIVPLPRKSNISPLGESRSQAVRRFQSLERSLHSKDQFGELSEVINEYFQQDHAELVPTADMEKPVSHVFYLPMHVVRKASSSTTKLRAVFDASASSSTGISLNDILLVGPTVHSPLVDVLLRFRLHRIALTADVSRMYRAILLDSDDKDLHRFVWRSSPTEPLRDYRMTRVTFGIAASSYAANMAVRQNALDLAHQFPLAAKAVELSFYVDDALTGADTVEEAITLQQQLQELFYRGGFTLRKWNFSNPLVLAHLSAELEDTQVRCTLPEASEYTKTLGIEWNTVSDHFRLTIAKPPPLHNVTKRLLISDVSKTFDVLGWFAPCTILMKILFQKLWELKLSWDDTVPESVKEPWLRWRSELPLLATKHIHRCYFPKQSQIVSFQLHGFCDASELAYAAVTYLRMTDTVGQVHIALINSKTRVAPIKSLTIPRLELCGACLLAELLHHLQSVFQIPSEHVFAWTDSTIVLSWLSMSPRRFKTYVANRVSRVIELVPTGHWNHVNGAENPADCASRGVFPSELVEHDLWWNGPQWLKLDHLHWPGKHLDLTLVPTTPQEEKLCLHIVANARIPIIPPDQYSTYSCLRYVTAWILRFIHNCRAAHKGSRRLSPHLSVTELQKADVYWFTIVQVHHFSDDLIRLKSGQQLRRSSPLLSLHPFLDENGLLRVGGREQYSNRFYCEQHPVILQGTHHITKLLIRSEHVRLLHAGPTLLHCSLNRWIHLIGGRKIVRSITRACVTCRKVAAKPQTQMMGQLPQERVTPDIVFDRVGLDYAGPLLLKTGSIRKPTIIKSYVCIFVSLSVKAVHLELVSDLSTEAFIACLRRFISRRGKPSLLWSDHGSNFVGACREIKALLDFIKSEAVQQSISKFCSVQNIQWEFIPPHAPNFGGLWEATVKSFKNHLRRIVGNVKLNFEEMYTVITQIEGCLNSRPISAIVQEDDGMEALTPGHFLIGRPMEALPDRSHTFTPRSVLRRWQLCQSLLRHFWQRWSQEYLVNLRQFKKWHGRTRNLTVGDIILLREDNTLPMKWPMARITKVHPGKDGLVRTVTAKTAIGMYTRPVTKVVLLLPSSLDDC